MTSPLAYDLKEYYLTPQGEAVAHLLARRFSAITAGRDAKGDILIGTGYAVPYLDGFHFRKSFALLPSAMGAMVWPGGADAHQRCMLADRGVWPLPAASIDMVLMVHELEYAEDPSHVLEEVWRVLKPEGKLVIVVPNRTGFWARAEKTPFGHGQPFTQKQLYELLRQGNFALERMSGALLAPPFRHAFYNRHLMPLVEMLAPFCGAFCGVMVAQASKRLYAPIRGKGRLVAAPRPVAWAGKTVPQGH